MINRKGGQPNQGICHKVKDGNGRFDCPTTNQTIFAVTTKQMPNLLIKTSLRFGSTGRSVPTLGNNESNGVRDL